MKTTIIKFLFTVVLISAISCTSDDGVTQESFRVKAVAILAPEFPSAEGDALELYGRISTVLTIGDETDEHFLWERNRDFYESVGTQEFLINSEGSERIFTVTEDELRSGAEFGFYTIMYDRDPDGNDDYLGNELRFQRVGIFSIIDDENNPVEFDFQLTEFSGVKVLVRFSVEHIRD
ncbi:hypothetical protein [Ascidiimonas sp. W6]|uniref:hypothetical protein n=1 Tax=Ascidiimonas meishanensis TaxID=3128903 RepID=UPI0030ED5819